VQLGVTVDLAGRGLHDTRARPLGQAEHVDRAVHAGLDRLHGIELVVHRRGRAGQVEDAIDLDIEREGDVVAHHLEARVVEQVRDVRAPPREVVVDAQHLVPGRHQALAQMRTQKAGAAGDQAALRLDRLVRFGHARPF
jgi:hypothetical protein